MKDFRTVMLVIHVSSMTDGRKALENVENIKFNSIKEIQNAICFNEHDPLATEDLDIIEMSDFIDLCNNTDCDTRKEDRVVVSNVWMGYVQLRN